MSDAVAAQGLADGNYRIGPQSVNVENGRAYVTGTKVLCGSTSALDECVKTLKEATGNGCFKNMNHRCLCIHFLCFLFSNLYILLQS